MKSTRERILQTLLTQPHSTINNLAEAVDINPISVRHHLNSLQADGLAVADEERHGVGRPRLVYSLTEKGLERFPSRYYLLTNRLLDQLKASLPQTAINDLFVQMASSLTSNYSQKLQTLSMEEKLNLIKEILAREGFVVEWEKQGDSYKIFEINCPYYHVGQSHPEVCAVDQSVISTILNISPEKIQCVLRGDAHCTYIIRDSNTLEIAS